MCIFRLYRNGALLFAIPSICFAFLQKGAKKEGSQIQTIIVYSVHSNFKKVSLFPFSSSFYFLKAYY